MINLTDKVCLITGADDGMGLGLVHGFLKRGAKVAAGLLDATKSATSVQPALPLQMDVTRSDEVHAAVAKAVATFGRIDVLINNAGIFPWHAADTMTWEDWRHVLDVNLDGTWRCCEAVIPHFIQQHDGVIINVGSTALRQVCRGCRITSPVKAVSWG